MKQESQSSFVSLDEQLLSLDGASFEWDIFVASHCLLSLRVHRINAETITIILGGVSYVNCPTKMHQVKMRIAKKNEVGKITQVLPGYGKAMQEMSSLFTFACAEGLFSILATNIWIEVGGEEEYLKLQRMDSYPLWVNGPTKEQL